MLSTNVADTTLTMYTRLDEWKRSLSVCLRTAGKTKLQATSRHAYANQLSGAPNMSGPLYHPHVIQHRLTFDGNYLDRYAIANRGSGNE
jgi:hypothetical protein